MPEAPVMTTRLWSEECALADAADQMDAPGRPPQLDKVIVYTFGGVIEFEDGAGPYANPAP